MSGNEPNEDEVDVFLIKIKDWKPDPNLLPLYKKAPRVKSPDEPIVLPPGYEPAPKKRKKRKTRKFDPMNPKELKIYTTVPKHPDPTCKHCKGEISRVRTFQYHVKHKRFPESCSDICERELREIQLEKDRQEAMKHEEKNIRWRKQEWERKQRLKMRGL